MTAASKRYVSVVQLLLEAGADPNLGDDDRNQAPLMVAIGASEQSRSICSLLIAAGANVNAQTTNGMTPLMWAAQFGKLEITEMLIQFGANISLKDIEEKNALNYANLYSPQNYSGAINVRHQEVIELLRKIEKTEN